MLQIANFADVDEIQSVLHRAFAKNAIDAYPFSAASVTEKTVNEWVSKSEVYVYKKDKVIAGVFRLNVYEEYGLVLSRLAVNPDFSGQKLGLELVSLAEKLAKACDTQQLTLKTPKEHPYLVQYYKSLGYKESGLSFKPGDKYVEVVLSKDI